MNDEKDLMALWKSEQNQPQTTKQVEDIQKKSYSIFHQFRWRMVIELVVSTMALFILYLTLQDMVVNIKYLYLFIVIPLMVGSTVIYFRIFFQLRKLEAIPVIESLARKIKVLNWYIRFHYFSLYIGFLIGSSLGIFLTTNVSELTTQKLLTVLGLCILYYLLFLWVGRKYIYRVYGKLRDNLVDSYEQWTKEEEV